MKFLEWLFTKTPHGTKIFEKIGEPMPNFSIVASHVRPVKNPKNYILDDGSKLKSIIEKWRFQPGGPVERCGYDYQMVLTNGELQVPVSICFACKTLVFNNTQVYRTSRRQIKTLLAQDFRRL